MSGDGDYVAVTVMNGSNRPKDHPAFNDYGLLQIYSVKGTNAHEKSRRPKSVIGVKARPSVEITRPS